MKSLEGKVAVVTGATSGIGARIAELFVAEGARVVLAGRREREGEERAAALGSSASFVRCDVSVEADVEALVGHAVERHGRLDVMVNNAGGPGNMASVTDFDAEVFARTLSVHVTGVMLGIKHAGRQMVAQGSGSIVNVASLAGKIAGWSGLDYSTAKAAVLHLTRCAAIDLGEHGVRVNSVSPGFVPTGIFAKGAGVEASAADASADSAVAVFETLMKDSQPIFRTISTDDIAAAALWFASDASRLVTGQDVGVDGGVSAGRPASVSRADRERIRGLLS
ncbi:SDR family NAD(P)-dependent oxidoreductase [Streptantibioticus cattleyicolor]|uniref:Short-chain alcohol dehydrogenase/reductase n=1 Tax=Streptantibioticus cattleyicolor (strain ATCC 35852 / DSM 46488 / JCM 4925 / NBRC 14057 / NRRL 8057) TaxID=1003195 RepID=F8JKM3_STREN|nr:SDR family oxidoreductase [Streptantibioticus cattleyicolor]AEW98486.1 short-chain alcohol dehydrogenase/reductase [Streptantibioticus cattleyicolor NRRL 8057 = DSM 46488]CCB72457.1 Sex determination protein tasselseed-2 [Streptantibioticus cattleyicolor NRRL 8057 = DSM 46488]